MSCFVLLISQRKKPENLNSKRMEKDIFLVRNQPSRTVEIGHRRQDTNLHLLTAFGLQVCQNSGPMYTKSELAPKSSTCISLPLELESIMALMSSSATLETNYISTTLTNMFLYKHSNSSSHSISDSAISWSIGSNCLILCLPLSATLSIRSILDFISSSRWLRVTQNTCFKLKKNRTICKISFIYTFPHPF